jgi:hypothetical protein
MPVVPATQDALGRKIKAQGDGPKQETLSEI